MKTITAAIPSLGEPLDNVVPFRAWRYSRQAGELSDLVAPPYDVIDAKLQRELHARSPHNVAQVDLGVTSDQDTDTDNRYSRAADLLAEWKTAGVLERDQHPSVTFVQEAFTGPDGRAGQRHGVLAALRLSEFGAGTVYPHERTLTGPKEDRFRLMDATSMSLSPVFLLYDLPGDDLTTAWKASLGSEPPSAETVDAAGNVTRLWPTSDPDLLRTVTAALADCRFLVADGHHRYETALRYQQARRKTDPDAPPGQAYDYCLVYLANVSDPALAIYPTHRLVRDLPAETVTALPQKLADAFEVQRLDAGDSPRHAPDHPAGTADARRAVAEYLSTHKQGAFGIWGQGLDAPYGVKLTQLSAAHVSSEHSNAYQELDVAILQSLVLEKALGISAEDIAAGKHLTFFKDTVDAFAHLESGEYQLGFFMNATPLDQVQQVAFAGERMPQKTTFFYPKLPTGLVFHELEGPL